MVRPPSYVPLEFGLSEGECSINSIFHRHKLIIQHTLISSSVDNTPLQRQTWSSFSQQYKKSSKAPVSSLWINAWASSSSPSWRSRSAWSECTSAQRKEHVCEQSVARRQFSWKRVDMSWRANYGLFQTGTCFLYRAPVWQRVVVVARCQSGQ